MPIPADQLMWLLTAALASGLVGLCLAVIGSELECATRRLHLKQDAARLREEQTSRLRELANAEASRGRRHSRTAPPDMQVLGDVDILN